MVESQAHPHPVWVAEQTRRSLRTIEANNGLIAFAALPELGAKIISLRDLRNGRDGCGRPTGFRSNGMRYGTSYIEKADTGGWDECFPTVAPCEYPLEPHRGVS